MLRKEGRAKVKKKETHKTKSNLKSCKKPICPDCGVVPPNFFFDMTSSEWICTGCGSVLTEIEVEFLGLTNHKSKQGVRDYHDGFRR